MKQLKEFLISFIGLKLGKHQFEYQLNNKFFEYFDFDEYLNSEIKVNLVLEKKQTLLELNFNHKGFVNLLCDTTGEPFDLQIKGKLKLIVQFGETFNNDNEELLILPLGEHQIDISQYIYEMIVLSVPLKRINPSIKTGTLSSHVLDKLNEISQIKEKKELKEEEHIDPRWEKLKQLLTDK